MNVAMPPSASPSGPTAQHRAGDPTASAWVSANAGSGKTYVLSRRVIRLLLAGADPSRLLCLTFTKAAAATMSNRVFAELARFTTLDETRLAAALTDIDGLAPSRDKLAVARRLFARAIETPGGLKIQTIHAFCERILQQFPLEADLGANFEILEEAVSGDLVRRATEAVIVAAAASGPDTPLGAAFGLLIDRLGEFGFHDALGAVVLKRHALRAWIRFGDNLDAALALVPDALGLPKGTTRAPVEAEIAASPHFDPAFLSRLVDALTASGTNDQKFAERLIAARDAAQPALKAAFWRAVFHKADGGAYAATSLGTKKIRETFADLGARCDAEIARLAPLCDRLAALDTADVTGALIRLGDAVVTHYEAAKSARGALDFDDLIGRTADLMSRSDGAAWVQYKLDQGIDHILVDEAQDTSPAQWEIVHALTQEFFAGRGAREGVRTVFAVGDEKQSIYSFQGAAPEEFAANRSRFRANTEAAGLVFENVQLFVSFRSNQDVLSAVDTVFARSGLVARLLSDPKDYADHTANRAAAPGYVEVWPLIEKSGIEEPQDWIAPVDRATDASPHVRLARRIADEIAAMTAPGVRLEGTGKPIRFGDILILVRSRGPFVDAMNRILKEKRLPVAGQDRLDLVSHIAVKDLIALGRVMLLPEDDLSLAVVLKSPLFGWSEDALYRVAAERDKDRDSLADALAKAADTDPLAAAAQERLEAWRALAIGARPYEFYMRVLSADGGRRRILARLGGEAEDVIDEFVALALAHEATGAPSLIAFLENLVAASPEVKREMDETRDEVRVMTVHGAKGLEAPVVFLVDNTRPPHEAKHDPKLVGLPSSAVPGAPEVLVLNLGKDGAPAPVRDVIEARREVGRAEYARLLYVGMTRAADRLYVCGHTTKKPDDDCWYQVVARALEPDWTPIERDGEVVAWRWRRTDFEPVAPTLAKDTAAARDHGRPDWLDRPAPGIDGLDRLTPSTALAEIATKEALPTYPPKSALDAALAPESVELLRGKLVHKLLETLPGMASETRRAAAGRYLARAGTRLGETERAAIFAEVLAILDDPAFAAAFGPDSRAEVPIVGTLLRAGGRRYAVSGQIDRLGLVDGRIQIVDYKTNRDPKLGGDGVPEAYVVQMALYRRLLRETFPGRAIEAAILWTTVPALVPVPAARLDAAEAKLAL